MNTDPLEALITQASYSKLQSDYDRIFAALETRTLFFAVTPGPPLTIATHRAGDIVALGGFLSRELVKHSPAVGGIVWTEVQTMLLKMPEEIRGVRVINAADDWVLFTRERILEHLAAGSSSD